MVYPAFVVWFDVLVLVMMLRDKYNWQSFILMELLAVLLSLVPFALYFLHLFSWMHLAVAVLILCTDQLSAHVCKPLFHRLRPCFNPDLEGLVHLPKGLPGGRYGFVSSHAANTFGVAAFLTAMLRKSYKSIGWWLYAWALVSSYSRIYIGVHYPGDIVGGALLGILIGLIIAKLLKHHLNRGADFDTPK
jgi:undecaprenyl-diphosphatase